MNIAEIKLDHFQTAVVRTEKIVMKEAYIYCYAIIKQKM